jgi:hypothetical protein
MVGAGVLIALFAVEKIARLMLGAPAAVPTLEAPQSGGA